MGRRKGEHGKTRNQTRTQWLFLSRPASPLHLSWLTKLINDPVQLFRRIILDHYPAALGLHGDAYLGAERFLEFFFNRFELVAQSSLFLLWRILEPGGERLGLAHRETLLHYHHRGLHLVPHALKG